MNESTATIEAENRAREVLAGYDAAAKVSDLYDSDHTFASALLDLVGSGFEYPDYSHLTVRQVLARHPDAYKEAAHEDWLEACEVQQANEWQDRMHP